MSLGKLPGIKSLMSGSQGKRHFKSDLSVDMISPPLGDFRHTMHVGRGGDVFGDTSFLSNHGGAAGDDGDAESTGFFSRTLRHVRKTPNRPRCGSRDFSPPPPPISPIIKNAISLPQLNLDTTNGCLQRVLFPSSPSSPGDISYTYGIQSGFLTLPRPSRTDRQLQPSSNPYSPEIHRESLLDSGGFSLVRSDSLGSFTVDLGPSLLSEVFAVIDSPTCVLEANYICMGEEPEVSQSLIPKSMVITGSTMEVGMQKDSGSKESLGIEVWAQDTGSLEGPMPDVAVGHVATPEPSIEPARFQRAADVLARHYGGNGLLQRQQQPEDGGFQEHSCAAISSTGTQKRAPYAYPEDEDEIKV